MTVKKHKPFWKRIPLLVGLVLWAKKQTLPGFKGVPIYDVLVFIFHEILDDDISTRANSMSFSFFLALFPGFIFLFTLIPLLPEAAQYAVDINQYMHGFMPESTELYVSEMIHDIMIRPRGGLLSIGLILSIIFASNGMLNLISSFEKNHYETFKSRHWIRKRIIAIALTLAVIVLFLVSSTFIVLGGKIINKVVSFFELDASIFLSFQLVRWFSVVLLIYSSIAVMYRYGPSLKKRISFFSIGTNVATILVIITSIGFSYFVSNFGKYNELYGSIGALIVFLVWINLNSFVLLIGFELNASIAVNRDILAEQRRQKLLEQAKNTSLDMEVE